eukprot:scaffold45829_cov57-Phaeocystis_antarctica.AAC.2
MFLFSRANATAPGLPVGAPPPVAPGSPRSPEPEKTGPATRRDRDADGPVKVRRSLPVYMHAQIVVAHAIKSTPLRRTTATATFRPAQARPTLSWAVATVNTGRRRPGRTRRSLR